VQVECYAGYKGAERPLAFRHGDRRVAVRDIVDTWYGPDHAYFKLTAEDGWLYLIRHDQGTDVWELILTEAPLLRREVSP
jgi:hypothetical protein